MEQQGSYSQEVSQQGPHMSQSQNSQQWGQSHPTQSWQSGGMGDPSYRNHNQHSASSSAAPPADAGAPMMDVSGLLGQLLAAGMITKADEKKEVEPEVIVPKYPVIEMTLDMDMLRKRNPG